LSAPIINPSHRILTPPVSNFELTSPGGTLSLSDVSAQMAVVMEVVEEQCAAGFRKAAEELATAQGRPAEDYLAHPATGLTMVLGMTPTEPPGEEPDATKQA